MALIGYRPVMWHLMKYYAHFGHREFIICLGYGAEVIKEYFLKYDECASNDFILAAGGTEVRLLSRDIDDWKITFVDTGPSASVGERLYAVRSHVGGDEAFLANYADGLTDLDLDMYVGKALAGSTLATFLAVRLPYAAHLVTADDGGTVRAVWSASATERWINAGFFVLRREIFEHMEPGDELVEQPFHRLIQSRQLRAHRYHGFWKAMDTFDGYRELADLYERGDAPWTVWRNSNRERKV